MVAPQNRRLGKGVASMSLKGAWGEPKMIRHLGGFCARNHCENEENFKFLTNYLHLRKRLPFKCYVTKGVGEGAGRQKVNGFD